MRFATEFGAAKAVAAKAGLGKVEPQLLKAAEHISVRLSPLPLVARIRSGATAERLTDLAREVEIARHLADLAAPAVRPASNVDPGPYFEGRCAISLWDFVDGLPVTSDADILEAARALSAVHKALDSAEMDLPPLAHALDSCEALLSESSRTPQLPADDRAFLARLFGKLRTELDRRRLVHRLLHGDAHMENALVTRSGVIWIDLEAVCTGPLEWDLASLPASALAEFEGFNDDAIPLVRDLRSLCVATWCWVQLDRNAETRGAAVHHLERLKARFG